MIVWGGRGEQKEMKLSTYLNYEKNISSNFLSDNNQKFASLLNQPLVSNFLFLILALLLEKEPLSAIFIIVHKNIQNKIFLYFFSPIKNQTVCFVIYLKNPSLFKNVS